MEPAKGGRVLLFLGQGFEDLEAVTVLDVCGWTEYRDNIPLVGVTTTGFHREMHGRFGLARKADVPFDDLRPADYAALALPGGFRSHGYEEVYDERLYGLIRSIHAQGGTIATMCVGALPVAEAGLLRGRRATTYPHSRHDNLARLRAAGAVPADEAVVVDGRIISCAGPAQSMEVAVLMLEAIIGSEAAGDLRRYLMLGEG